MPGRQKKGLVEKERLRTALTETPARVLLSLLAIVFISEAAVMSASLCCCQRASMRTSRRCAMPALLTLISCPIAWWLLTYPLRSHAHRLTDLNEQLSSEITRRASLESKLRHQALHDSLTDLPNRALFVKRLQASLRRKKKSADYGFAVLFIDLDRFKAINDSLGHAAGDQVLVQIAKRLESIVRPADLLARVGGDEFTLLLEEMLEPGDAAKVAERIVDHLSRPLSLVELETEGKDPEPHLTASIGIAWGETRYEHADQLLRDADIAMYRAKSKGWGGFQVFDADMHRRAIEKLWTESALRQSVRSLGTENPRFCLRYQPIISLSNLYPTARSWDSRRCYAGVIRNVAWCRRPSSYRRRSRLD
jgi:diguanylate cyclase (GGDEF)-like protein